MISLIATLGTVISLISWLNLYINQKDSKTTWMFSIGSVIASSCFTIYNAAYNDYLPMVINLIIVFITIHLLVIKIYDHVRTK